MSDDKPNSFVLHSGPITGFVVLMGIGTLLMSLIAPAIQKSRESARRMQSKNNLKQIGLALQNYHDVFDMFPPGGVFSADEKAFHGWMTFITPYLDASPWYNRVNFNSPWDDPSQIEHFQPGYWLSFLNPSVPVRCTADGLMHTHYAGSDLMLYRNSSTGIKDLVNGTSNTLCVGDAKSEFEPFGYPYNWRDPALGLNQTDAGFGCATREITMMLMADAAVRNFSHKTDEALFVSLRGSNAKQDAAPADVAKPAESYRISPPIVCLWADPPTGSSLLGIQSESQKIVRAWFLNSGWTWHETPPRTWDQQAELLKGHDSLRELNLRDALSDQGVCVLKELPELETLQIHSPAVTDRGFQCLSQCPKLKHLELTSSTLGDTGWKALAKAPQLKSMKIHFYFRDEVRFSPQAVVNFLEQKPDCEVIIWRGDQITVPTIRELARLGQPWPKYTDSHRGK